MPTDLHMLIAFGYIIFAKDAFSAIGWSCLMSKVQVLYYKKIPIQIKQKQPIVSGFRISVSCVR